MSLQQVSLKDRTDLSKRHVLLSGIQALVRLPLMQKARDARAGHDTAGYVTGYRGSPLGGVDLQMMRAKPAEWKQRVDVELSMRVKPADMPANPPVRLPDIPSRLGRGTLTGPPPPPEAVLPPPTCPM